MSRRVSQDLLGTYAITETQCSNPTAEFVAYAEVLKELEVCRLDGWTIIFHIDYVGVKHWIEGTWKAKETYIKKIRDTSLTRMKNLKCTIHIEYVKGHSGDTGNDKADALAGNVSDFSNFHELNE